MEIKFPCGAKGRPEFCPDLCNYGKFCKMKERRRKDDLIVPSPIEETENESDNEEIEGADEENTNVEIYY